jgi:hypothetical protein
MCLVVEKNVFRWATLVDRLRFSLCIRNSKEGPYSTPLLRAIDPTHYGIAMIVANKVVASAHSLL